MTLSLSCNSMTLLVLALLLGATSIWRDIEKRYTATLLGLPLPRSTYILGRFAGLAAFLLLCGLVLGACACLVVLMTQQEMSAGLDLIWLNLWLAIMGDVCKAVLLVALALFFSSLSTSLFLPVFGTIGVYLAGSASQEVMDYLTTEAGRSLPSLTKSIAQGLYYLLPNFSVFDFKIQAIYGLSIPPAAVFYAFSYFVIYTGIVLFFTIAVFNRRELQ